MRLKGCRDGKDSQASPQSSLSYMLLSRLRYSPKNKNKGDNILKQLTVFYHLQKRGLLKRIERPTSMSSRGKKTSSEERIVRQVRQTTKNKQRETPDT